MLDKLLEDINQQQRQATEPSLSTFVSASAGTGKTKVLVDRFIRLMLEENVEPKKILCITYTNTAADEIKHRLISKLAELNRNSDSSSHINKVYQTFLLQYNDLKIFTIHGFCYQILRRYWASKNQRPKEIIDSEQGSLFLKNAIINAILEQKAEAARLFCEYEIVYLQKILSSAIHAYQTHQLEFIKVEELVADSFAELYQSHKGKFEAAFLREFADQKELIDFLRIFFYTKSGKKRKKLVTLEHLSEKDFEEIELLTDEAFDKFREAKFQNINHDIGVLFDAAYAEYSKAKEENFLIDFNDILRDTLYALKNDENAVQLLYHIDLSIDHIMVDEAQDTSPVQWKILKLIAAEYFAGEARREIVPTIFIVGDFKQSIYSFQGANPFAFHSASEHFAHLADASNQQFSRIEFNTSFRSSPTILQFVDQVFDDKVMQNAITGGENTVQHLPFKSDDGAVFLHPIIEEIKDIAKPSSEELEVALADEIANQIILQLNQNRVLIGATRAIKPSDFMVIFRKRSKAYYRLIENLAAADLPVSSNQSLNLADSESLQSLASILRFICFPYDNRNLFELLQSPFLELEEDLITQIFFDRGKDPGLERLRKITPNLITVLEEWMQLRPQNTVNILEELMVGQNYLDAFIKRYGLEFKKQYNAFMEAVTNCEASHGVDLLEFVTTYLDKMKVSEKFNNNADAIKVITAHAAKGLQSKIVILADSTATDNNPHDAILVSDQQRRILFTPRKEYQVKWLEDEILQNKLKDYCENLRLLYVSLTRAENEIHIYGRKTKNMQNSWYNILSTKHLESYQRDYQYLDKGIESSINKNVELPQFHHKSVNENIDEIETLHLYNIGLKSGEKLHKFLQHSSLLSNTNSTESAEMKNAINAIKKHPQFFEGNSMSEVELMDIDQNGNKKSYVIDKLIISDDKAIIVDFKSDRTITDAKMQKYKLQIMRYKRIVSEIYPNHEVEGYLLFCHPHVDQIRKA